MTSRERLKATLNHQAPDRVCMDLGSTATTGIAAAAVSRLRRKVLGQEDYRVKVIEPGQMLGEVDEELGQALGIDVVGIARKMTKFGFANENWKPFELFDGTPVLVPEKFNVTVDANGDLLMYPEGDTSAPPSARMPKDGFYFDTIIRQQPIDEEHLDPTDNLEEFAPLGEEEVLHVAERAAKVAQTIEYGAVLILSGAGFGDISQVTAPGLKHPKGIRDVEEWYVSTITRRDYVYKVFEGQCEIAINNIEKLATAVGDRVQVIFVGGTDFGTQRGLFISVDDYRTLYKPFHKKITDLIHEKTEWKTMIHSCGSVVELIGEFIDAGFDILNPVQCSAAGMDPRGLKKSFGDDIVFWGGGVDTQRTLPFGTPDDVYNEVRQRIDIFNEGGGFVFNPVHNIQPDTPVENILAMFRGIRDSAS